MEKVFNYSTNGNAFMIVLLETRLSRVLVSGFGECLLSL